jgi:hypothetical protein
VVDHYWQRFMEVSGRIFIMLQRVLAGRFHFLSFAVVQTDGPAFAMNTLPNEFLCLGSW